MKLDRFNRSCFEQGEALAVVETVEDGQARLLLKLDHADAVLLKVPATHAFTQMNEWSARHVKLEELGSTRVHTVALDPASGAAQYQFN